MRRSVTGQIITTIIPDHDELAPGTLRGILDQAKISVDDFLTAAGRV